MAVLVLLKFFSVDISLIDRLHGGGVLVLLGHLHCGGDFALFW